MNKRQRKKQHTKEQRRREQERQEAIERINQIPNIVRGWIRKVNEFFYKSVEERPEQVREYLLDKPGPLSEWEQELLERAETILAGRRNE